METYISYPPNPTQTRLICSGLHVRVQHEHAISITWTRSRLMLLGLDAVFEEEFDLSAHQLNRMESKRRTNARAIMRIGFCIITRSVLYTRPNTFWNRTLYCVRQELF